MKIVCFSDTHSKHLPVRIPKGDMLIFCGDFTGRDSFTEIYGFLHWFSQHPHKYKILVAGNHDRVCEVNYNLIKSTLEDKNIIYLQNSEVIIEGIKIYGTPVQPPFNFWAFNYNEIDRAYYYSKIPKDTDILITHCPPYGILDRCPDGSVGCRALRNEVLNRIQPRYHIFGHIHESYGKEKVPCGNNNYQSEITFVNCSVLDGNYNLVNKPITIKY
jgi:Icc-related predicted phosphoesterase